MMTVIRDNVSRTKGEVEKPEIWTNEDEKSENESNVRGKKVMVFKGLQLCGAQRKRHRHPYSSTLRISREPHIGRL